MATYFEAKNNNNEFVISDNYSHLVLEEVINLGSLGSYSISNESDGGICDIGTYYNPNDNTYKYPFFCCLGTKRKDKYCVLYNSSSIARPVTLSNNVTGICRSYNQGTRKAHSITIRGEKQYNVSWSANMTDLYKLYYTNLYPDDSTGGIPLEVLPQCLGTAIQPVAIICDSNANHINLKDYYVMVFGIQNYKKPQSNEGALCCYDYAGNLCFSSINQPLVISNILNGLSPANISPKNYGYKIGLCSNVYTDIAMPILTSRSLGLKNEAFWFPTNGNVNNEFIWRMFYMRALSNAYYNSDAYVAPYNYTVVNLDMICNYYGI